LERLGSFGSALALSSIYLSGHGVFTRPRVRTLKAEEQAVKRIGLRAATTIAWAQNMVTRTIE